MEDITGSHASASVACTSHAWRHTSRLTESFPITWAMCPVVRSKTSISSIENRLASVYWSNHLNPMFTVASSCSFSLWEYIKLYCMYCLKKNVNKVWKLVVSWFALALLAEQQRKRTSYKHFPVAPTSVKRRVMLAGKLIMCIICAVISLGLISKSAFGTDAAYLRLLNVPAIKYRVHTGHAFQADLVCTVSGILAKVHIVRPDGCWHLPYCRLWNLLINRIHCHLASRLTLLGSQPF